MAEGISIRKYEMGDRADVRRIAVATAMVGHPGNSFIDGDELLADVLTVYFTDHEPGSCFVAARDERIVGYIIGAVDTKRMDAVVSQHIVWSLFGKAFSSGAFLQPKNLSLLWRFCVSFMSGELASPKYYSQYPATLHINLDADARGHGVGAGLMRAYLAYLKDQGIKGVQMATMSPGSADFFLKQGFTLLFKGRRSYFRHILGKDVPLFIFGKAIGPGPDVRRPL